MFFSRLVGSWLVAGRCLTSPDAERDWNNENIFVIKYTFWSEKDAQICAVIYVREDGSIIRRIAQIRYRTSFFSLPVRSARASLKRMAPNRSRVRLMQECCVSISLTLSFFQHPKSYDVASIEVIDSIQT